VKRGIFCRTSPVSGSNSEALDLVVEQLDAQRQLALLGREHVDGVAAHAELPR
jgi:hypothetical protein